MNKRQFMKSLGVSGAVGITGIASTQVAHAQTAYGWVSVTDYGATGNGVMDDTMAIKNAIMSGRSVYFPKGTYLVTSPLTPSQNTRWFGDGMEASVLLGMGNTVISRINPDHHPEKLNFHLSHLTCDSGGITENVIEFGLANFVTIDHVRVKGADLGVSGTGIHFSEVFFYEITRCWVEHCSGACINLARGPDHGCNNGTVQGCELIGNDQSNSIGLSISGQNVLVMGNDLEGSGSGNKGIALRDTEGVSIRDNYIELWPNGAIDASDGKNKRLSIEGNVLNAASIVNGTMYMPELPVVNLSSSDEPNTNIDIRKNRFADMHSPALCVHVGNASLVSVQGNDRNNARMTEQYDDSPIEGGWLPFNVAWSNLGTLGPGGFARKAFTAEGAEPGDPAFVSFDQIPEGQAIILNAYVSAPNTVTVVLQNIDVTGVVVPDGVLTAYVLKR